ncbi:hypothetical protein VZT92_014530 [Zoarces viviparus]|uniref:Uncharacterized protein n=1 Tax=Zoarces viviparus TaxID=48416 RepID=A0AAW1F0Y2_ZOAVI
MYRGLCDDFRFGGWAALDFFLRRKQMSRCVSGRAGQADEVKVCPNPCCTVTVKASPPLRKPASSLTMSRGLSAI